MTNNDVEFIEIKKEGKLLFRIFMLIIYWVRSRVYYMTNRFIYGTRFTSSVLDFQEPFEPRLKYGFPWLIFDSSH